MAKGMSVHVGVNATEAPGINAPTLVGAERDALDMSKLARARNFLPVDDGPDPIVGGDATFATVMEKILAASTKLDDGDIFLFTFSGHGTRRGAEDKTEKDWKDETVVLHDKLLVDNVLRRSLWPKFQPGVRVVMVSDSCHSGGVAMAAVDDSESDFESINSGSSGVSVATRRESGWLGATAAQTVTANARSENGFHAREVALGETQTHFDLLKDFYKQLRDGLPAKPNGDAPDVQARVLLLAACRENEKTLDGPNGVFTDALLKVFSTNGATTYKQLMEAITQKLKADGRTSNPKIVSLPETATFEDTEAFRI